MLKGAAMARQRKLSVTSTLLIIMLGLTSCSRVHARPQWRKLLQASGPPAVTATTSTPVMVNAQEPAVQATTGPAGDKLHSLAAALAEAKAAKKAPQQPAATIVVPAPQVAAIPTTTTGSIGLTTSTPVKVSSPITVSTPVEQKSFQKGQHQWPIDLNTLINGANLLTNVAGAAGSIAGAVPGYINLGGGWGPLGPLGPLPPLDIPLRDLSVGDLVGGLSAVARGDSFSSGVAGADKVGAGGVGSGGKPAKPELPALPSGAPNKPAAPKTP